MYGAVHPGDDGNTQISPQRRVPKDDPHLELLGALEELQAQIALITSGLSHPGMRAILRRLIQDLQDFALTIAQSTAPPPPHNSRQEVPQSFPLDALEFIELATERLVAASPLQVDVLLPSGPAPAVHAAMARAICRRAERRLVRLARDRRLPGVLVRTLNRLGDFLFALHRFLLSHPDCLRAESSDRTEDSPLVYGPRDARLPWSDDLIPIAPFDGRHG